MLPRIWSKWVTNIIGGNVQEKSVIECNRKVCLLLKKLNMKPPYDLVITLLGIFLREMKTSVHIKTCLYVYIYIYIYILCKSAMWGCSTQT